MHVLRRLILPNIFSSSISKFPLTLVVREIIPPRTQLITNSAFRGGSTIPALKPVPTASQIIIPGCRLGNASNISEKTTRTSVRRCAIWVFLQDEGYIVIEGGWRCSRGRGRRDGERRKIQVSFGVRLWMISCKQSEQSCFSRTQKEISQLWDNKPNFQSYHWRQWRCYFSLPLFVRNILENLRSGGTMRRVFLRYIIELVYLSSPIC